MARFVVVGWFWHLRTQPQKNHQYLNGNWAYAVGWALAPLALAFMMATGCYRCAGVASFVIPSGHMDQTMPPRNKMRSTISLMSVVLPHQAPPKGQGYPSFPCAGGFLTHPSTTDVTAILQNRAKGQRSATGRVGQRPSSLNTRNSPSDLVFLLVGIQVFSVLASQNPFLRIAGLQHPVPRVCVPLSSWYNSRLGLAVSRWIVVFYKNYTRILGYTQFSTHADIADIILYP